MSITEHRAEYERSAARDYKAFARTDAAPGWRRVVLAETSAWLRSKGLIVDLGANGAHEFDLGRHVAVRAHRGGYEEGVRVTLDEDNEGGHWTTALTLVEGDKGGGWLSLEVSSSAGAFVPQPRLIGMLLALVPLRDGPAELRVGPRVVRLEDVPEALELLASPERRDPVFVAATDEALPFDPFLGFIETVSGQTVGLGHTLVLDADASREVAQRMGPNWAPPPWTVRTYLPGVDIDDPGAARAHRILGTQRLAQDRDVYLRTLLGTFARSIVASRPVPGPLAHWSRIFDRLATRDTADAILSPTSRPVPARAELGMRPAPADSPVEALTAELTRVRVTLGLDDLSEAALLALFESATEPRVDPASAAAAARRLDELQARVEALEADLDVTKAEVIDARLDALEFSEQFDDKDRRLAQTGRQLVEMSRGGAKPAERTIDELGTPLSYDELIDRFGALGEVGVVVTAELSVILDLQQLDRDGLALGAAWSALQALAGFVQARGDGVIEGSVHQYLHAQPAGYRSFPVTRHSYSETGTTMTHFGSERLLPVPATIDPSGFAVMRSHFKLARMARRDPRLYYLDDTATSRTVVVGYIGPHMTNTQT